MNKINDMFLLNEIRKITYDGNDIRASWIGDEEADSDNEEFYNIRNFANEHRNMYIYFLDFFENYKNNKMKILDFGCGSGFSTLLLSNFFKNSFITGIEINDNCLNFCNKYNKNKNIEYKKLLEKDYKFDIIFFLETFEHIKYPNNIVLFDKLLKSTKYLVFTTPNARFEQDHSDGHIGLLNHERFSEFYKRYSNKIIIQSYYDNNKLLISNPVVDGDYSIYDPNIDKFSHFRMILKNE